MRKKWNVITALVLCLCMLTGCASIAGESSPAAKTPQPEQKAQETAPAETAVTETPAPETEKGETVYRANFVPLQDVGLTSAIRNLTVSGDQIYFTSIGILGDRTPEGVEPE